MLAALDLRNFYRINACAGRAGSDRVLGALGARLASAFGRRATIAREGANRFLFLFDAGDAPDGGVPEALLAAVAAPFHRDEMVLYLSAVARPERHARMRREPPGDRPLPRQARPGHAGDHPAQAGVALTGRVRSSGYSTTYFVQSQVVLMP